MYEKHFGLKRTPFRADATGADVFVGPQTAKFMVAMKKGLTSSDAIVVVTGDPGVGKSTLVNRAIDSVGAENLVVRIGRMRLGHDEVLDFLLEKLEARDIPASTIKKINLFHDLLAKRTSAGTRAFIVIEDAVRIGEDALAEFEALCAADSDHPEGASIILMGDESLHERLASPALLRIKQRTRLRQMVLPLGASELQGYLKHCFRLAGGEFDLTFATRAGRMLFELSEGNPRVANNIVEAILAAAAEQGTTKIDAALVSRIASEQHGLSVNVPIEAPKPVAEAPAPEPVVESANVPPAKPEAAPVPVPKSELKPEPELSQDTLPDLEVLAPELAAQGLVISRDSEPPVSADDDIPTLFDSTRMTTPTPEPVPEPVAKSAPTIEAIQPRQPAPEPVPEPEPKPSLALEPEPQQAPEPQLVREPPPAPEPKAVREPQPAPESRAVPKAQPEQVAVDVEPTPAAQEDWDRDPTLAELRPDIEALELAMADFKDKDDDDEETDAEPLPDVHLKDPTLPSVPMITLDEAIDQKVSEAQDALEKADAAANPNAEDEKNNASSAPEPKVGVPPLVSPVPEVRDQKADAELEKIATGLASAKSIEDVDDQMAETLFGEEFSLIAAQVVAKVEAEAVQQESANDELETLQEPVKEPATLAKVENKAPTESSLEREFKEVYGENAQEVSIETKSGGLDLSASQRLATVRALNADQAPEVGTPAKEHTAPVPAAEPPQPIEDQINTSMTQTLKALGTRPQATAYNEEDDEETKSGFFSRFKRS
jgi:general secretion pathway protein A